MAMKFLKLAAFPVGAIALELLTCWVSPLSRIGESDDMNLGEMLGFLFHLPGTVVWSGLGGDLRLEPRFCFLTGLLQWVLILRFGVWLFVTNRRPARKSESAPVRTDKPAEDHL